ncbi:uncharacterized protein BJ212DRAFT_1371613 [Suillus subaureus]|uniref:Uncharacterized protein n=1 Tax=Suillus subaureus TaxID=48587 RepID=A0A9P7E6H0_9AGAM|nr:uncharacterized protein BJ212DRAFT_1371613 [Suillus subaureus]KAG1812135.1 hypothetical protein BJ212DRAFT_1371613 [Suillus subaureus]
MTTATCTQNHTANYSPHDSIPRSLGDQNSIEWNSLQDRMSMDAASHHSSQDNQALALKALESKVDGYFHTLIEKMVKQETNIETLMTKSDSQEAKLSYHHSLIEEQGKDMRKVFEDLAKRIEELDTSIITKLGVMIRGTK